MQIASETIDNQKLSYRMDSHDYSMIEEIWRNKQYSEHFPFDKKVAVIDIGAHNGYFSTYASVHLDKEGCVYAFEPVKENYELLVRNLEANNLHNVFAENVAIGEKDGALDLFINSAHTGGHSIFKERVDVYHIPSVEQIKVPCISLETIIQKISLSIGMCKIDCEGAEFDILQASSAQILKQIPVYGIEFHEFGKHTVDELVDLFRCLEYQIYYEYTPSKRGISFGMLWAWT